MKTATLVTSILLTIVAGLACEPVFAAQSWKFAVTGDSRGENLSYPVNAMLSEIVGAILTEDVDFVLFPGDLIYGHPTDPCNLEDQFRIWRDTMQPVYDAGIKVYPVRGNHDQHDEYSKDVWDTVFSGPYANPDNGPPGEENITFSFKHKNAFIVGLDLYGNGGHTFTSQPWLDEQFASSDQPHVFVFAHVAAFRVRNVSLGYYSRTRRDRLWESIAAEGGRTYFVAHDHFYNHARIDDGDGDPNNDLHQYVVATAGAGLYDWDGLYDGVNSYWTPQPIYHEKNYGYSLVEINGHDVTTTWVHRIAPNTFEATSDVFHYSVPSYSGGTGEPDNPYLIATADDLNAIGADPNDWDKHFRLVADIDMADYTGTEFNIAGRFYGWNDPNNEPFAGVFDGNGHTIANLTYSAGHADDIGLFGFVDTTNAEIRDLTLIDPNIYVGTGAYTGALAGGFRGGTLSNCAVIGGSVSGHSDTGGLVGFSRDCTILNCYTTCSVSGPDDTGGLVGATGRDEIRNCYATGNVSGHHDIGGLIGDCGWSVVTSCFATGDVSGYDDVGGLAGDCDWGTISNCYATGDVISIFSSGHEIGGLLGENGEATVINCYAVGSVSDSANSGGLIAIDINGTTIDSFWDTETSGQTGSAGGIGKTTAEMHQQSTFTGWDFINVWDIGENQTCPYLRTHSPGDLNKDRITNFLDLCIVAEQWMKEE